MNTEIKAGIIGAAGYTGGELLRILLNHPQVKISFAQSKSHAGHLLYEVHPDLTGDTEMRFSALAGEADVLFLCSGHGEARKFIEQTRLNPETKVIDLSQDFRLKNSVSKEKWVYGLPELNRQSIASCSRLANPGCFATCIQLGLLPLAAAGLLKTDIHVSATTGSTGAGQSLSPSSHFSWRQNNLSIYKAFEHQHLAEIGQSLCQLQEGFDGTIHFIPQRGSFTRGILAAIYLDCNLTDKEVASLYQQYFETHPFVYLSKGPLDLKQVLNTNKCFLQLEKHEGRLLITSVIDNLLKGASGQAVQNMNLMFGLEEYSGLKLKASAF
ncbi:MAG TPA: N-acetyl-gamma-glutamyl-phosphate reductase [Bacteroidia bacterium]|jgi:N-acetyl-gamma-glutamyl-phosphate reductase|nr:N-acetyl-gamma-glutamyl-phosphate reductase [Bacteroidia bacterium]